jgi:hypothetical protein
MEDKKNIIKAGALVTDTSMIDQPQGTHRFVLNAVNETDEGDSGNRITEESNAPCYPIPTGFIPTGSIYISDEKTIQFFASSIGNSIIAVLDRECNLDIVFNDSLQVNKLGLSVAHQVQGIFRLRLGCEICIYFTDDNTKMKYFNVSKPAEFKAEDDTWDINKFLLIKEYNNIPEFAIVQVLNSGGIIEPGSVNIAIEYVDEGLNPTEWITTSQVVEIYNDSIADSYLKINGSINSDLDYLAFPATNKSIRVVLDNLDASFPFYRLAFMEANAGTGKVNSVKYTELIPISKNFFIYTGENFVSEGTLEEIAFFTTHISKARVLEQIENTLTIHNTQGKKANLCNLQKYASRIKADVELKKVILNQTTDPRNGKNPTMQFGDMLTGGLGHMPGEIESFGIVYVFDDGYTSPVCHIPGKNNSILEGTVFSPGPNIKAMRSTNNSSANNKYIDNDSCDNNIFWGLDSEGQPLDGAFVRHHRFPSRAELGIPLFQEESTSGDNTIVYYKVKLTIGGTIVLPSECPLDPDTGKLTLCAPSFSVRVTFTVDGVEETLNYLIDPINFSNPINREVFSNLYTSSTIVLVKIEETNDGTTFTTVVEGAASPKGATYNVDVVEDAYTSETKVYSTQILGIKFSGIDLPPLSETNGEQIVGYYIVRNERTENERTILDSGVLVPTVKNSKFTAHGLLNPEIDSTKINPKVVALIHPEHKFNNKEYVNFDYLKQEGNFNITSTNKSRIRYNDVFDGTGYDGSVHKEGNSDGNNPDGWCLKVVIRDNYTQFISKVGFTIDRVINIDESFYLNALENRNNEEGTEVLYNISSDNKIGMLVLKENLTEILTDKLPYVIIGRNILDPYSNYRLLPYFKCSINVQTASTTTIFSGDSYVAPMRYCNTIFFENKVANRAGKTSAWNYIIGGVLIVVGAVLAFFTAGASTVIISAGVSIIGAGALFLSSGIKRDAMVKAYEEDYDKGLRETALDNWVAEEYRGANDGPSDDEIQWIGDCITDLWFETAVNVPLRNGMTSGISTFMPSPGIKESGASYPENIWEYFGKHYFSDVSRFPISKLEYHFANKLLTYDSSRNDNRVYIGAALGEYYSVNPDYQRYNQEKYFYHLPLEYDCCSDCQETFPHRVHWSQQSFQEELTDNFRVFLPNNYKDIEGETGEITDAFRFGDRLYIHTEEALWYLANNNQERVTGDIISFIGTGDLFNIPPKKIVDDRNNSAGSLHRWAKIKSKNGVFFPSYRDKKWYMFDGQKLNPISDMGNYNFFKENMHFEVLNKYYADNLKNYPYYNNPSNPIGVGFLSVYDTKKERLIITKKDFIVTNIVDEEGYELCSEGGNTIIFRNIEETIFNKVNDGYTYLGVENCKLKFSRIEYETIMEEREITTIVSLPNDADVIVHLDMSGSFNAGSRAQIKTAVTDWYNDFQTDNPEWTGNLYYSQQDGYESQRCWKILKFILDGSNITTPAGIPVLAATISKNIVAVSFVNENKIGDYGTNICYHGNLVNPLEDGASDFYDDYDAFIPLYNSLVLEGGSFSALNYPIVYTRLGSTRGFLQHVLAVMKGVSYTLAEVDAIEYNPFTAPGEWDTLKLALQGVNPYPNDGMENYGWIVKSNRGWSGTGDVITSAQFQEDMNTFLEGSTTTTTEIIVIDVLVPVTIYEYIEGEPIELETQAAGWTMSYSLKEALWIGYHGYIPDYYFYVQEKFYSWKNGLSNLYKHGIKGSYLVFYGETHAFIIEVVDNFGPAQTKISEHIFFNTEAKIFDSSTQEFLDREDVTFNKLLVYNSKQISGELALVTKTLEGSYLVEQTLNEAGTITVERTEKDWRVNELRDIRVNNTIPMFRKDIDSLQPNYYIDKIVNPTAIDFNKSWMEMESFRDKYLVIRLSFDTFTNVRLISNFIAQNKNVSER